MAKVNQRNFKQKLLKAKSEKGSVTVFVVTTMLFLLMALIITYMGISNKNNSQNADINKIKAEYEKQMGDIDQIYEETKAKTMVNIEIECEKEYNIAKGATVTIPAKITLTAEDMSIVAKSEYAWSTSGTTKPSSWTEFTGASVSTKRENASQGEYYLWVRITTSSGAKVEQASDAIIVNEGEITLTPSTTEPTKGPVNVAIDYENTFTQDKKVGTGKTPEEAKANATLNENTNLEITENCFIYVTAKDAYGNPGEATLQIDNIDNVKPEITLTPNGGKYKIKDEEKKAITVKVEAKDIGSGLNELKYAWSTSNTEKPQDTEYTTITSGETVTSQEYGQGTYYLWVIATDKAGNIAEEASWAYEVTPPAAPTIDLKLNDASGAQYTSGTWTNQNIYADVSLPKDEGTVVKYQYLHNGMEWEDISAETKVKSVNYSTTFPLTSDGKPDWFGDLTDTENTNNYHMVVEGTTLVPNNGKVDNSQADSYIPIDLSDFTEEDELTITINAKVSSESVSYDFGYAYITESTEKPNYNGGTGIISILKIGGTVNDKDYTGIIKGGKVYYLHIGYRKDGSVSSGDDKCTINSIKLESATLGSAVNFYEYTKNENTITFKLEDEINKDFYVKALYEDGTESNVSQFKACIDKTAPVINTISSELVSQTKAKINVSNIVENASGVRGYYISKEEQVPTAESEWIEVEGNSFEVENLDIATNYNIWVIDNAGNISAVKTIETEQPNYKIDATKYSSTLQKALELANENSTIELLRDYTDSSTATINKNIILDTENFVLTRTVTTRVSGVPVTLTFNGKITSNTSTITTSGITTINGTGTIESTSTSSSHAAVYVNDGAVLTQDGNITVSGYYKGVYNYGIFNLNSGKVESTNSNSGYAIYNYTSGDITNIYNGEIVGYYGIYNNGSSNTNIYGGKIEGTGINGVYIYSGNFNVKEGEIIGKTSGIYIDSSGTTNITGGVIKGAYGIQVYSPLATVNVLGGTTVGSTYGIYGSYASNGKITIGDINTEVNDKQPVISGGQYGVYMNSTSYSYNFNNGIIMGTNTTPYTETINPREGYMIYTYYSYNARRYCSILAKAVDEITIEHTPATEWANTSVEVQVLYPILEGATLEYSEDGENWTNVSNGYRTNVYENKTVYARMLDASGIILGKAEHEITNIDKIAPEVKIEPETTKYTIYDKEGDSVNINLNVIATDEGGSELKVSKYAWSDSKETEPTTWIEFTDSTQILKENCKQGTYYLWFDVEDNAGNKSDIEVISYIVDEEQAVAKIGEEYYYTIQAAFDAAGTTPSTVEIIRDTNETAELAENQDIILELNGHTIGGSTQETPVITNNGTLKIIDSSSEKTGTIENFVGTALVNNGTLTLGENDNDKPENSPTISGKKTGIKNTNTVNYYDGTIQGKTAIEGEIQDTPQDYGPVGVYENGITKINLKVISGYVARIEYTYYAELQTAFDACESKPNNTKQTTVHLLKDLVLENGTSTYLGQNVRFNLNGHTLTSNNNSVIANVSKLEITDLTEEQNGNIYSSVSGVYSYSNSNYYKLIDNKAELVVSRGNITTDKNYNYPIYNDDNGIVNMNGGKINSSSYGRNISGAVQAYGIYNYGTGIINVNGGVINSVGEGYAVAYGIYNFGSGTINANNGDINSKDSYNITYGIYNENTGIINLNGGNINSITDSYNSTCGILNNSEGIVNILDGTIKSNNDNSNGGAQTEGIRCGLSNNGTVNIKGGIIECKDKTGLNCYGITNGTKGIINVDGGEVISINNAKGDSPKNSYGISNSGIVNIEKVEIYSRKSSTFYGGNFSYGIYNKEKGRININGGNINSESESKEISCGLYNEKEGIVDITDGTINSNSYTMAYGIQNEGIISLGKKEDGSVNNKLPNIKAEGMSANPVGYGICNDFDGRFSFYDGKIEASTDTIIGGVNEIEEGYKIKEENNNLKCIYLTESMEEEHIVKNIKTEKRYTTLKRAIEETSEIEEIELEILNDFDLQEPIYISKEKNIILNFNGHNIKNLYMNIINEGKLAIKDSVGGGILDCYSSKICNTGELKITSGTIKNDSNGTTYGINNDSLGTVNVEGGVLNINSNSNTSVGLRRTSASVYGINNDRSIKCKRGNYKCQF